MSDTLADTIFEVYDELGYVLGRYATKELAEARVKSLYWDWWAEDKPSPLDYYFREVPRCKEVSN